MRYGFVTAAFLFSVLQFGRIHAAAESWAYLVTGPDGTKYEYDTRTFSSSRERAGGWIRVPFSGGYDLSGIGVRCGSPSDYVIYHTRRLANDGTLLSSSDQYKSNAIAPRSNEEKLRDALCSKRTKLQQWLGP